MHTCPEAQRQLGEADMIYNGAVWGVAIWQAPRDPVSGGPGAARARWGGRRGQPEGRAGLGSVSAHPVHGGSR